MSTVTVNNNIMTEKLEKNLFSEFRPNTLQEWKDKVIADLKGADFDKKLVWRTNEGFNVQPMYRKEHREVLKNLDSLPGEFPFLRGNKKDNNDWFVRQDIKVNNIEEANAKALDVLNKGITSLGFIFEDTRNLKVDEMKALLKGIELDCIEINFVSDCGRCNLMQVFKDTVIDLGYTLDKIYGGITVDPLSDYLRFGKLDIQSTFEKAAFNSNRMKDFPNFKTLEIGGYLFNNSGSSIVQELAYSLAIGVEYIEQLTNLGMTINEILPRLRFHFATGSKYFMEIAKLRAARYLWSNITKAYSPESDELCKMNIHSETSEWNKTIYDPNVNMLRTQTEAMSATLGGVESFTVHPYNDIYETSGIFSERIARNQQLLLKEESHFAKVVDAAGGSYYIEELTESIIDAAWDLFLKVQEEGGYIKAIQSGSVQSSVKQTAEARNKAIAERKENLLGTNQYPNFLEVLKNGLSDDALRPNDQTLDGADIETLKPYRGSMEFETLRLKTDLYSLENGRPKVYMIPIGNLAMRKARAQFACNFFACAGFDVEDNNGFKTPEEGVKAAKDKNAKIVVICSSDDEYLEYATEVYEKIKDDAIVVVAGNPSSRQELEEKGIVNFIHVKNNVLKELTAYQTLLGIK